MNIMYDKNIKSVNQVEIVKPNACFFGLKDHSFVPYGETWW